MAVPPDLGEQYLPLERLGHGAMAEVWRIEDRHTGEILAAKILPELSGPQELDLLRREFQIGRRLDHPNIVRTIQIVDQGSRPFLVLEHVPGTHAGTLAGGPMDQMLRVLADVARALQHAHERGVVHRDLKPRNILLDEAGRPHVADFGIADMVDTARFAPPLVGGGSPAGMSPQQLDGEPATTADDLYSFGALLQQLITGAPPLGSHPSHHQLHTANPQPLSAGWPVPPDLQALVTSLLSKKPEDRPRDMAAVAAALDSIRSAAVNHTTPPRRGVAKTSVKITPPPRAEAIRPMATGIADSDQTPNRTRPAPRVGWATAVAIIVLGGILAIVIFVLPGLVGKPPTTVSTPHPKTAPPSHGASLADEPTVPPPVPEALAGEARSRYTNQRQTAEAMGVSTWAKADYLNAISLGDVGDQRYRELDYDRAASAYSEAAGALAQIVERGSQVLAGALADGERALANGNSAVAVEAFERALAVDPENGRARTGFQRASVQDEVLALLDHGAQNEGAGDHAAASADYHAALRLDPDSRGARAGVARTSRALADDAFSLRMSEGLVALDQGDTAGARAAFLLAGDLRPTAPEVAEAMRRLDRLQRRQTLAALRKAAESAEGEEDWQAAADLYDQVLSLDSNLAFAVTGKERSQRRMELTRRIDFHLDNPERLVSDDALADAETVLAAALETQPRGPEIDNRTSRLASLVAESSTFVPVAFQSDNLTDVMIYKFGRLGSFTTKTLELRPGTYTVVGNRPGYRDVRIQLIVRPGTAVPTVVIRCKEAV